MARSHNVYIVMPKPISDGSPLAAFTVKHECKTWLERRAKRMPVRPAVTVWRVSDGLWDDCRKIKQLSEEVFLET